MKSIYKIKKPQETISNLGDVKLFLWPNIPGVYDT